MWNFTRVFSRRFLYATAFLLALWIVGFWFSMATYFWWSNGSMLVIMSGDQGFSWIVLVADPPPPQLQTDWVVHSANDPDIPFGLGQFELHRASYLLLIPLILAAALVSRLGPPFLMRRRRKLLGLCTRCGYDLRTTIERCPECGQKMSKG